MLSFSARTTGSTIREASSLRSARLAHKMKAPAPRGRRVRGLSFVAVLCVLFAASPPLRGEEPAVTLGKQRAARSTVEWNVQDIDHALLGPIRFAVQKGAVTTAVGSEKVFSQVFVSCQKSNGKMAIELTNAPGSDLAGGLRPTEMPRLVCNRPGPRGGGKLVRSDVAAKWEISTLGDTLARGLAASELRRCVSIDVQQSLALPPGAPRPSQRIAMEILPYDKALDSVFSACGERTAFGPVDEAPPAAPPVTRPGPAPAPEGGQPAQPVEAPWKPARTTPKGRTIVRAAASVDSPIVIKLAPGTQILVRRTSSPWWEVKPRAGAGFRGFIREDRLVIE